MMKNLVDSLTKTVSQSSRVRKHKINKSQTNEKLLRRKGFRNKKNCGKYAKIFSPSLLLICQYILHLSIFIEHLFPFIILIISTF